MVKNQASKRKPEPASDGGKSKGKQRMPVKKSSKSTKAQLRQAVSKSKVNVISQGRATPYNKKKVINEAVEADLRPKVSTLTVPKLPPRPRKTKAKADKAAVGSKQKQQMLGYDAAAMNDQ